MGTQSKSLFKAQEDYRLALAMYCLEVLDKLANEGQIPGIKKDEAIQLLEKITSTVAKMREWTRPKKFLLVSNHFRAYNNLLSTFISRLGINWFRIAKRKNDYNAKLLRFAIFNLRSLGSRLKKCSDDDPSGAVKIAFVRVLQTRPHPRDRNMKIAYVTDMEMTYEVVVDGELPDKAIVAFAHLPPRKIKGFVSEGIIIKDENGDYLMGSEEVLGQRPQDIPEKAKEEIMGVVEELIEDYMI